MAGWNASAAMLLFMAVLVSPAWADDEGAGERWAALNHQAGVLLKQGQYDAAMQIAVDAVKVAMLNVGPDHPDLASSLHTQAMIYEEQARYDLAEPLYVRALARVQQWAQATRNGAIVMPPVPGFYNRPRTIADLVTQSVGRALDLFGIDPHVVKRWKETDAGRK